MMHLMKKWPFTMDLRALINRGMTEAINSDITYPAGGDKSYTRDTYKLALDGTIIMVDSEHFEDTSWYREWEANHPYDESRRYDDDSLDAFEGDSSNRWNID